MAMQISDRPEIPFDSRVNPYFPHQVLMESTSACQLRCAMCARESVMRNGKFRIGHMEQWLAEKIIDEVAQVNPQTRLWFCFFGEPLISKHLPGRIRLAKKRGIQTTIINTNGNLLNVRRAHELIDAGLDEVYIGLDATTPETYARVRVRGDYERVVQNIKYLLDHKPKSMKVTVQFGVYKENEHELEAFKNFWSDFEVSVYIRPKVTWLGYLSEHYHSDEPRYPCPWILDSFSIFWNGLVSYCICDWENRAPVGDVRNQSILEIWQTVLRQKQNLHLSGCFEELPEFCRNCRDWQAKKCPETAKKLQAHGWTFNEIYMPVPATMRLHQ